MGSCLSTSFHSQGNRLGSDNGDHSDNHESGGAAARRRAQAANTESDRANRVAAAEARQKREAQRGKAAHPIATTSP